MAFQIDQDGLATKAIESLINQCKKDPKISNNAYIQLVINTNKPIGIKNDYVPRIIPLQHTKMNKPSDLRILLIVKDPSTMYRDALKADESTADMFADIISVKNLRKKFKGSRLTQLFKDFDMVVADYRVHHLLPHILGPTFYKSNKKVPFIVQTSRQVKEGKKKMVDEIDTKYVRAQIRSICRNSCYLPNSDKCLNVRVGRLGVHSIEDILHNISDVVDFLCDKNKKPQGGCVRGGIRSLFLKTSNSTSLPIYQAPVPKEPEPLEEVTL
ncbi:HHL275Cp [Eremothecium sinecaudum]|uniref:HHL275Cp n=1 Tax=Eremothecium sinecaudum TaxID=45286 RepID=A0A0X8HVZ9_9SACH|nr:HHL275Cp [Eremothecium sinecaudum]AMD22495.1 HHL275Cp [Eremothecium sinecaudum]